MRRMAALALVLLLGACDGHLARLDRCGGQWEVVTMDWLDSQSALVAG